MSNTVETSPPPGPMTVETYLAWSATRPARPRHELVDGHVVAMAEERRAHRRAKFAAAKELERAVARAGLPCHVDPDGAGVRVDDRNAFIPDALVFCGDDVPDDSLFVADPIIIVEVVSPSSEYHDTGAKLSYFRLPSVRHYLVVYPTPRRLVHHERGAGDALATRILHAGSLRLDPPGLEIDVGALFG